MGYHRAGFDVVGVDIRPQPNYPFRFHQADALDVLATFVEHRELGVLSEWIYVDAIHASPPCQRWADGFVKYRARHPDLIAATRELLVATGLPYVMENVRRAPLRDPVLICGGGLGCVSGDLQLHRHRKFESNRPLMGVPCSRIRRHTVSVVGNGTPSGNKRTIGRNPRIREKREAMGVDWHMTRNELSEAIPPVYTEFLGLQLREIL